jgi:hypothetical protein
MAQPFFVMARPFFLMARLDRAIDLSITLMPMGRSGRPMTMSCIALRRATRYPGYGYTLERKHTMRQKRRRAANTIGGTIAWTTGGLNCNGFSIMRTAML